MKFVIAIDSFKGSLSSKVAGQIVARAVKDVCTDAEVKVFPFADGGEGTVEAITSACGGSYREVTVKNPIGKEIKAVYGIIPETNTAVVEAASAAGLTLIDADERNPLVTTTYGFGEMIRDAIENGCRRFIVGIGGSATNDGGVGMLQALGFGFCDESGKDVPFGANGLKVLKSIKTENALNELDKCEFLVACDVKNPLYGETGCSRIFARQKGGTDETIPLMDEWMKKYAETTKMVANGADPFASGAGAAGGLGFAFMNYLNGKLQPGVELVIDETGLEKAIKDADYVITGEGRLDGQTIMGKAPYGIARVAKKYGVPVIALCGCVGKGAERCNDLIDAFFPIIRKPCSEEEAMEENNAKKNLYATATQAIKLLKLKR